VLAYNSPKGCRHYVIMIIMEFAFYLYPLCALKYARIDLADRKLIGKEDN